MTVPSKKEGHSKECPFVLGFGRPRGGASPYSGREGNCQLLPCKPKVVCKLQPIGYDETKTGGRTQVVGRESGPSADRERYAPGRAGRSSECITSDGFQVGTAGDFAAVGGVNGPLHQMVRIHTRDVYTSAIRNCSSYSGSVSGFPNDSKSKGGIPTCDPYPWAGKEQANGP